MNTLVITGGSKGIGRATVRRFLDAGYRVVNLSRSDCPEPGVTQLHVDLADASWAEAHGAAVVEAVSDSASICLVHNSGLLRKDSVRDLDGTALTAALQVNVVAAQQLNGLLLPLMRPGSSIVYVGSTLGDKAVPGACSYVVSKHAQIGLMRATCQDLAGSGIHTACVCPGFTDTEMLRAHVGGQQEVLDSLGAGVCFGRLIEPAEIAATIAFCAANPVINGAVIHANLGQIQS